MFVEFTSPSSLSSIFGAIFMQVRMLALVGGGTVGQTARHIMKKLMSDIVAVGYNFKGKGAKRSSQLKEQRLWYVHLCTRIISVTKV